MALQRKVAYGAMYFRDFVFGMIAIGWRFCLGRCLDGKRRTNASFFHPGTSINTPTGRASKWCHLPGYQRALWRMLGASIVLSSAWGMMFYSEATRTTWRVGLACAFPIAAFAGVQRGREWTHRKKIVALAKSTAEKAGYSDQADPFKWIDAPLGYKKDPDKIITMTMSEGYAATDNARKSLAKQSARKLGLRDEYEERWDDEERTRLQLSSKPLPRKLVSFEHIRSAFDACPPNSLVMGLKSRDKVREISLDSDSPHFLASIGSGGGKSEFGKVCALQMVRRGARVVIIDIVKRGASHKWAKGFPGVEVYRHADVAHSVLLEIQDMVESRCESYWHNGGNPNEQRVFVIIEESNQTIRSLNRFWRNDMEENGTSPAVLAIEGILCVGREAKVNVMAVGQRMSAQASGGGDARENYGVKLGNRYSPQTAKMLFSDCEVTPKSYNHPGLVQVVTNNTAELVQIPLLDDEAAFEWAIAARPKLDTSKSDSTDVSSRHLIAVPTELGSETEETPGSGRGTPLTDLRQLRYIEDEEVTRETNRFISLREAVTLEIVSVSLAVLKNERTRDPEFPQARDRSGSGATGTMLYDPRELVRWERNRAARSTDSGDGAS